MSAELPVLSQADFASDQEVRWCPGCGDYSILAQMKKVLPTLGVRPESTVFISGIGCSSRFPYYMNTYGIHSIHGRAPAFATGLKSSRPDLSVWVITGDGDALSIGGNHFMHAIRRNIDINIILFNNSIYGLTKGQYSPTSPVGKITKSTPRGSIDHPLNPLSVAIASEATFVARSIDTDIKHLGETLNRAARHKGTSFVEVYQNCNVFNDGAWDHMKDKSTKADHTLFLKHGEPMLFGANGEKALQLDGMTPRIVSADSDNVWIHDETLSNPAHAFLLSRLRVPQYPEPVGVLRAVERATYDESLNDQIESVIREKGRGILDELMNSGDTWTVS
jgi:2-oxoglutarate ferredoxin oxidoreductase subunit beta